MNENDRNLDGNTQENGEKLIDDSSPKLVIKIPSNQVFEANDSSIFKLNIDCFEVLFEWLKIRYLLKLRQTCKRMMQIVDYYILQIYPHGFGRLTIHSSDMKPIYPDGRIPFAPIGRRILSLDHLRQCDSKISKLFKHFYFKLSSVDHISYRNIEHILRDVEILSLDTTSGFCKPFLAFCKNLKCLCIYGVGTFENLIKNDEDWFHQSHPMLAELVLTYPHATPTGLALLQKVFDHNPRIKKLTITSTFLQDNHEWIMSSNIHLDQLVIDQNTKRNGVPYYHLHNDLLNELYDKQSFYQRLHLYVGLLTRYPVDEITNIHGLEKINITFILKREVNLPQIKHLKELSINDLSHVFSCDISDAIADKYANFEKFRIENGSFSDILPFIRRCAKLKEIRFRNAHGPYVSKDRIIDLVGLDTERRKCPGGRNVTLYVHENMYLQTKLITNHTNFGLIEIRINSKYYNDYLMSI